MLSFFNRQTLFGGALIETAKVRRPGRFGGGGAAAGASQWQTSKSHTGPISNRNLVSSFSRFSFVATLRVDARDEKKRENVLKKLEDVQKNGLRLINEPPFICRWLISPTEGRVSGN